MLIEILILLITTLLAYFLFTHKKLQNYFRERDVKFLPGYPIFGNTFASSLSRRHIIDDLDAVYKAFPEERYVGYIEATAPIFMIRDPEVIKLVTVKDFDHFVDHKNFFPPDSEPLFNNSVFMLHGDKWRDMRTTLSPAFTGSKMRHMVPFMNEIANNFVNYLEEHIDEDIDMNDLIRRYTNDVIASAGFGLQVDSLKDKDNKFYKLGQMSLNFTTWQKFLFFLTAVCPKLLTKFGLKIFSDEMTHFFRNLVKDTIEYREKNKVERPDMIHLLMQAIKGNLKADTNEDDNVGFATVQEELKPQGRKRDWSLDELTGQVFIFFVAGFESSASVLVMTIHELILKPDIQEKLYQEIKTFEETRGTLSYDNINELKYLDCVMNETLRKWSPATIMDRLCTKTYQLPPPREGAKPVTLNPGDVVYCMVNTIHMDPKHFPDPEKFDPDRFSDENKHNIKPFTFMPFGMGPRNCIGSRFALLELKVLLYNILLNFKCVKGPKTPDPIILDPAQAFNIRALGGLHIRLQKRQ